ncbi:helix-turn-helix domain-containing protein [Streptomyces sp. NBC_01180]|uniref:helix-turn-helix domain-containing protein n=1 Tax=Streptomyces sp. NBC_01180 TaxID=2903763 RepID=UPI00386691D9
MDTQQVSAPPRAPSRDLRGAVASRAMSSSAMSSSSAPASAGPSGVVHINSRHTACFTVVGNHLAQHRGLSLVAIALAVHIQSLPAGARIGVKVLADRFPESEARVAAALRELEAHGYLRRTRERLPNGRVVTRTVSYNQPGNQPGADVSPGHVPPTSARAAQRKAPLPSPSRTLSAPSRPVPAPTAHASATHAPRSCLVTESRVSVTPRPQPPQPSPSSPRPALPQPLVPDAERHRVAVELLSGLRRAEPTLLLAETDITRLAPAVAAWLERDAHPDAVRAVLTTNLPEPLRRPGALLAHRLAALVPPRLPALRGREGARRPAPLQNCDICDRAFRSPEPGRCRGCRDCRTGRRGPDGGGEPGGESRA